ncbi:MAG: terminase gpA endonuclease subunit [Sulfitobacter sp.]
MVTLSETGLRSLHELPPLQPYVTPEDLIREALPFLDPPSRMSVTDAAELYVRVPLGGVWQNYDRMQTPYMVEPADTTQSRRFQMGAFVGPSQSGKTKALEVIALHSVMCDPSPVQIVHMTKTDGDAWVQEKLDKTIENSPLIAARLGKLRADSTFSRKRFRGSTLTISYPVARQLSARTQRLVLLTDFDHMPQSLGPADQPEGTPVGLSLARVRTYMSRGFVFVEGSPAFYALKGKAAKLDIPGSHALPPVSAGVVNLYNGGTRGRWYWECRDCGDEFEPRFDRLHYDANLAPHDAGRTAELMCPHCGSLIAPKHKAEFNRTALDGRGGWRHESASGEIVPIENAREVECASWALNGVAAAFSRWSSMVTRFEEAKALAERMGDDTALATVYFTEIGVPFKGHKAASDEDLTLEILQKHLIDAPRGVCPEGTRFVTVSVDVQKARFPVSVYAWAANGARVLIDRFDIIQPPSDAPHAEGRAIDPARYREDWAALEGLASQVYPVAGTSYGLMPLALAVDFQGQAGVSDNAEIFWRKQNKEGYRGRWFLTRGHGGTRLDARIWYASPERGSKGKKARGVKLLNMAVDRLKDSTFAALCRLQGGDGSLRLCAWLSEELIEEHIAEESTEKGWRKKEGVSRNEAIDHAVQALALAEHKGAHRINYVEACPAWAEASALNTFAVDLSADDEPPDETGGDPAPTPKPKPATPRSSGAKRIKYLRR